MCRVTAYILLVCTPAFAQVLDVNGDNQVGPHEAIAVKEQWKGPASGPNDHNHLGQTWRPELRGSPLEIRGNFPFQTIIIGTQDGEEKQTDFKETGAPLILDNTATNGMDLLLGGILGEIGAIDFEFSNMQLTSNGDIKLMVQNDGTGNTGKFLVESGQDGPLLSLLDSGSMSLRVELRILEEGGSSVVARIDQDGDMQMDGNLTVDGTINALNLKSRVAKGNGEAAPQIVSSSLPMEVLTGEIILDEMGEARVELPYEFTDYFDRFRYQLTAIGGSAPGLHIAEEVTDSRFAIAGGNARTKICWQVIGVFDSP